MPPPPADWLRLCRDVSPRGRLPVDDALSWRKHAVPDVEGSRGTYGRWPGLLLQVVLHAQGFEEHVGCRVEDPNTPEILCISFKLQEVNDDSLDQTNA